MIERSRERVPSFVPALAVAAIAIAYFINRRSIWLDEAYSWYFASQRLSDMFGATRFEDSILLVYYGALHLWQAFGHSAVALRAFSAAWALAAVPMVAAIAHRLFGRAHAVLASLILASNAAYLYYATEARPYGAVLFFAALSMYLFLRAVYDDDPRFVPWYAIAACAAIYFHALAVLLPIAQGASLFVMRTQRRLRIVFTCCYAALAVALIPLILLARRGGTAQIAWIPDLSRATAVSFVQQLAGTLPLAAMMALLVIISLRNARNDPARRVIVLIVWAAGPIVLGALVSLHQHIFIGRYFLYTLIPGCVLAAHGLLSLRPAFVRAAAAIALLAAVAHGLWYLSGFQAEDWRSAVAYVNANALPGDGRIVYAPYEVMPYRYALSESGATDVPLLYPSGGSLRLSQYTRRLPLSAQALRAFGSHRVWIILARTPDIARTPLRAAPATARLVSVRRFDGIAVMLFAPRS